MFSALRTRTLKNRSVSKSLIRQELRQRLLRMERLENRYLLATLYVDNASDYAITNDTGAAGLSAGDTVTWNPGPGSQHAGPVGGLTFGTDAFSDIQSAVNASSNGD